MKKTYRVNEPDVISEKMGNEVVVINMETGCYYSLNKTAAAIWDLVLKGFSEDQITGHMLKNFNKSDKMVLKHIEDFLKHLQKECLIVEDASTPPLEKSSVPEIDDSFEYEKPDITKHSDMQEMLKLDPIHEVTDLGWPSRKE